MHKTVGESVETAAALAEHIDEATGVDVMVAPPFTALSSVSATFLGTRIRLGAQDVFWEPEGAYTGEISACMLTDVGCHYVIIGHSERRALFRETDETVNRKIRSALDENLIPVVCVGESEEERDAGKTFSVLDKQVEIGLNELLHNQTLVVAYEPIWAIGTGKTATAEQAQEVHAHIRTRLENAGGRETAESIRILYGGSVKPENAGQLMSMPDIDGALVGGASLSAETFARIINAASSTTE
jgi:triosephosphate isomerase